MNSIERTWSEHFTWHIRQAPFQLAHMRELSQNPIGAVDTAAVKVAGGKDEAALPYRVDPADDADLLYATLILFGQEVAEKIGGASPRALRARMWRGQHEPQGLPSCDAREAFSLAAEITMWLEACAHEIEHRAAAGEFGDAPDDLVRVIRQMRARYRRSQPQFHAYRPRPCPICGERTIRPQWNAEGLTGAVCDSCGQTWEKKPA